MSKKTAKHGGRGVWAPLLKRAAAQWSLVQARLVSTLSSEPKLKTALEWCETHSLESTLIATGLHQALLLWLSGPVLIKALGVEGLQGRRIAVGRKCHDACIPCLHLRLCPCLSLCSPGRSDRPAGSPALGPVPRHLPPPGRGTQVLCRRNQGACPVPMSEELTFDHSEYRIASHRWILPAALYLVIALLSLALWWPQWWTHVTSAALVVLYGRQAAGSDSATWRNCQHAAGTLILVYVLTDIDGRLVLGGR